MRPLRLLILMLVLVAALLVALMRPLPTLAGDTIAAAKKGTRKTSTRAAARRQHMLAKRRLDHKRRAALVKYSKRFIGTPYSWGGSSPRTGFDCSGFVRYVFQHFNISLPHSSYGQEARGRSVLRKYLMPGDLVFFNGGGHVGIYIGRNRLIDAPHSGAVVHISTMTDWYSYDYSGGRRILPS